MLKGLTGRACQPATRSAVGHAAPTRRCLPHTNRHPRPAEHSGTARPVAMPNAHRVGERFAVPTYAERH